MSAKIVFIAHQVGAPTLEGLESNLINLRSFLKRVYVDHPEVIPFVSYYTDIDITEGPVSEVAILRSGLINELWLTGKRVSKSMEKLWTLAESLDITVINKTEITLTKL